MGNFSRELLVDLLLALFNLDRESGRFLRFARILPFLLILVLRVFLAVWLELLSFFVNKKSVKFELVAHGARNLIDCFKDVPLGLVDFYAGLRYGVFDAVSSLLRLAVNHERKYDPFYLLVNFFAPLFDALPSIFHHLSPFLQIILNEF